MREIRNMAAGMKDAVAALKKDAASATGEFQSELTRAKTNTEKFKSFTTDLKEANQEVEAFLGETGSNFPTSEASPTPDAHADRNGVTLNKG